MEENKRLRSTAQLQKMRGEVDITDETWLSLEEFRQIHPKHDSAVDTDE